MANSEVGKPLRLRERPSVVCGACGSRFTDDDARPGAGATCPLCGALVEVGPLVEEKRRVPSALREALSLSRVPRSRIARTLLRMAVVLMGAAGLAVLWTYRAEVVAALQPAEAGDQR